MSVNASAASLQERPTVARPVIVYAEWRTALSIVSIMSSFRFGEGRCALMDRGRLLPRVEAGPTASLPD